jgi:putative ABC transport system permease protein
MRAQFVVECLGESVLISLLALVLALAMAEILVPAYSEFLQVPLSLNYPSDWAVVLGMLAIALLAGLIGGIYPAIVLSGFRPASILRANSSAILVRGLCARFWWCCSLR